MIDGFHEYAGETTKPDKIYLKTIGHRKEGGNRNRQNRKNRKTITVWK